MFRQHIIVDVLAPKRADLLLLGLLLLLLAPLYAFTLAPGITWANSGADSGDLAAATATLGIAHPTGYPSYLLLARLFQLLVPGDPAWASNLFSACCALLTVLLLYWLARLLLPGEDWGARVAAALAALSLGLAPVFWSQALIAEVYSLNALLSVLLLLCIRGALQADGSRPGWWLAAQGALAGFALGNHVTIALLVLIWLVVANLRVAAGQRLRAGGLQLLGLASGLLVYLYLPLRAATQPPVNWGNPVDWAGFWWVVSGQPYRDLAFGLPAEFLSQRLAAWAGLLLQQFGLAGLLLGFGGLFYGSSSSPAFVRLTLLPAALYSLFAVAYNTADSYAYLIPFYLIFALWIALGACALLAAWQRRWPATVALPVLLLVLLLGWPLPRSAQQVSARQDDRAIRYATTVLRNAPPAALLVTQSDRDSFPLWYYQYALEQRPDVVVIVEPLLEYPWYREQLAALYPALTMPEQRGAGWLAAIAAANQRAGPLCRVVAPEPLPQLDCEE